MQNLEYPCPHCGQPIPPKTIICPFCQTVVMDGQQSDAWTPPPVSRAGTGPLAKKRRTFLICGFVAANLAAAALIGLGFWLEHLNGETAGVLISSDFLLVPLVMGLLAAFFWKDLALTTTEYFVYSLINSAGGLACAAVFMGEGIICLVIVSPLLLGFVFVGALLGRWLFQRRNSRLNLSLIPLALAILVADVHTPHHYENAVSDRVVIHAPPAQVWAHLAAVPPITEKPDFWLFQMGLPYPVQSTVSGIGVGARRRCLFSHNRVFEEKITEWSPGRKLTFEITQQPRDPEILGHARVERGQFVLEDNHDGSTTLTGTSWYELSVYPAWYYDLWASRIARAVHLRVMGHIKTLCEHEKWEHEK
jgi:hypothetical protein